MNKIEKRYKKKGTLLNNGYEYYKLYSDNDDTYKLVEDVLIKYKEKSEIPESIYIFKKSRGTSYQREITYNDLNSYKKLVDILLEIANGYTRGFGADVKKSLLQEIQFIYDSDWLDSDLLDK